MRWTMSYVVGLAAVASCGGATDGGTPTTPAPVVPAPASPVVTTVTVSVAAASIEAGATTTASAGVLDQNGAPIAGKTATWSSDNEGVATVSQSGTVTGLGLGTANIIATVDGKQGKASASVTAWTLDGVVFTNGDYPGSKGGFADVSAVRLLDGSTRMFIGASPAGAVVISALSNDGVKFTLEPGHRIESPLSVGGSVGGTDHRPLVFRLDDGRLRMFEVVRGSTCTLPVGCPPPLEPGFYSLTSTDEGLTWRTDAGVRLTRAATGLSSLLTGAVVKLKSGGWRFFFSDNPPSVAQGDGSIQLGSPMIKSAYSTDLMTWTMDPGVRVGAGAPLSGTGQAPAAVTNADGSITLIYFRNKTGVTMQATAADGLNFTTETSTGFGVKDRLKVPAFDTFAMALPNGDVRLYFNFGNDTSGTVYSAHHAGFSLAK